MKKEIIISSTTSENRIAITEDGKLTELFIENESYASLIGDIYLGRIAKVIPGIKAAFIDLGFKQDAFLHFSDVGDQDDEYGKLFGEDDDFEEEEDDDEDEPETRTQTQRRNRYTRELPKLEKDKNIIVQIIKEPVGNKGVRVTSKISLPGRYLVLLPFDQRLNVSKKIYDFREKRRLKGIIRGFLRENSFEYGAIIRTVAEYKSDNEIKEDIQNLINVWKEIEQNVKKEKPPALLYKDLSLTSSVIRDLLRDDVEKVITDSKKLYREITSYLKINSPDFLTRVELYRNSQPLFDVYSLENEIKMTLNKKVELKSGGYIFVEHTEAMVVIDVNSGKYAKSKDQETNSLKTNLEAAREIVRQTRLRDLGGIIVIDFIDVYDDKNKKKIYDELRKEFRKDKAKVTILPMSEFGIVQITRQRVRQSIVKTISETCPVCGGTGMIESVENIITRIEKWVRRFKSSNGKMSYPKLILQANPGLFKILDSGFPSIITRLGIKYLIRLKLEENNELEFTDFRFLYPKDKTDLTKQYSS